MSLSRGLPGLILFWMPSSPAIIIAAQAMYGFAVGYGQGNSSRLAFGESPPMGMRTDADRLRDEYARLTGASKPGTSRLYELVPGFVNAQMAGACLRIPPM